MHSSATGTATPALAAPIRTPETESAPDAAAVDPLLVLHALCQPGPAQAFPVGGGADTATWRIEQADRRFALRVFRPEQAALGRCEVAAMDLAFAGGLLVPAVYACCCTWATGMPCSIWTCTR